MVPFLMALTLVAAGAPEDVGAVAAASARGTAIVEELVTLAEGGVAPGVMHERLRDYTKPFTISTEQLVRLSEAGVREDVVVSLLRRSRLLGSPEGVSGLDPEEKGAWEAPDSAREALPGRGSEESEEPPTGVEPLPPAVAADTTGREVKAEETVRALVSVEHRSAYESGHDGYVYLDGEVVTYLPEPAFSLMKKRLTFERRLTPGFHRLVLSVESHEKVGGDRRSHESRIAPGSFDFELPAGSPVEIQLVEGGGGRGLGPRDEAWTLRVKREGRTIHEESLATGDPNGWPWMCDDLRISAEARGKTSRLTRKKLEGCREWTEVWRGSPGEGVAREEALDLLGRYGYKPVPSS